MPWFKVDDALAMHMKAFAAGNRALGLWVRAGSWSMHQLSDGFIPQGVITALSGTTADATSLVQSGLWDRADGGYQFHDWSEYQPTREQVIAEREKEREKKRIQRAKGAESAARGSDGKYSSPGDNPRDEQGESTATRPVPSRPLDSSKTYTDQSLDNRANESTDAFEIAEVTKSMAAQAGIKDLAAIARGVQERTSITLNGFGAMTLATHLLGKAKAYPDSPDGYVRRCLTNSPAEIERFIYDSGLAPEMERP